MRVRGNIKTRLITPCMRRRVLQTWDETTSKAIGVASARQNFQRDRTQHWIEPQVLYSQTAGSQTRRKIHHGPMRCEEVEVMILLAITICEDLLRETKCTPNHRRIPTWSL